MSETAFRVGDVSTSLLPRVFVSVARNRLWQGTGFFLLLFPISQLTLASTAWLLHTGR